MYEVNFLLGNQYFQTFRKKCNLHSNPFPTHDSCGINNILLQVATKSALRVPVQYTLYEWNKSSETGRQSPAGKRDNY